MQTRSDTAAIAILVALITATTTLGCGRRVGRTRPRPDARVKGCVSCAAAAKPDAAVARKTPLPRPDAAAPARPRGPKPVPLKPLLGGHLAELKRHANATMTSVRHVQFSRDGGTLALGMDYGHLALWRLQDGKPLQLAHRQVLDSVLALAFSPDGLTLAVAGTQYEGLRSHGRRRSRAASAPRQRHFDAVILLLSARSGDALRTLYRERDGSVVDVAFSTDGRWLVSSHRARQMPSWLRPRAAQKPRPPRATFRFWDPATWRQARAVSAPVNGTPYLALLGKGARIAYPYLSAIKVLDTEKKRITRTVRAHRAGPSVEDDREDESFLTLAVPFNRVSQLILWRPRRITPRRRFRFAPDETGACGAFVGDKLVLGGANLRQSSGAPARGLVRLWEQRTGRLRRRLRDLPFEVNDCSATADGLLAIGGRHLIRPGRSTGAVLLLAAPTPQRRRKR